MKSCLYSDLNIEKIYRVTDEVCDYWCIHKFNASSGFCNEDECKCQPNEISVQLLPDISKSETPAKGNYSVDRFFEYDDII